MAFERIHGAVHQSLAREFHGIFDVKITAVDTTVAGSVIVEEDPERIVISFIDTTGAIQKVAPRRVLPNGDGFDIPAGRDRTFTLREHFLLPAMRWVNCTASIGTLWVVEVIKVARLNKADIAYLKEGE